ncbi:Hsp20/alpha crystallin family protein [Ligilactobacillus cholophilus]|uniref:Hsp20/alpha crystallin family protein n=1 Tax=Ligilactobacillus cholophilus TaxID=3050131 RepID=UPI0025B17C07|nr:Hsp20/alpha crystallin family protein [Ligilactobacillus cholophilus]
MSNDLIDRFNKLANTNDFFNDFGRSFFNSWNNEIKPLKSDIKETDKEYIIKIDMPGVDKKDIAVNFKDDVLTVDAKRESFSDDSDKKGNMIASERDYGTYSRSYRLPKVDSKQIVAKYTDGVLTITLPKTKEEIDSNHNIDIQ